MKDYPEWICIDCAREHDGRMPENHVATWHIAPCDVCGVTRVVTEPRDFRYPDFGDFKSKRNRLKVSDPAP